MAVAIGWTGAVDLDLDFAEFFESDFTIALRFLPQYPNGYEGPILAVNGVGTFLIAQSVPLRTSDNHVDAPGLLIRVGSSAQMIGATLGSTTWTHLAVVRSADVLTVYLDGAALGAPVTLSPSDTPTGTLRCGKVAPGSFVNDRDAQFYGLIEDLAVYSRALDGSELEYLGERRRPFNGRESHLLAGYPLTHSSGSLTEPRFNRPVDLLGAAAYVSMSGGRSGTTDASRIPLPVHDVLELPVTSYDSWLVRQGFAAGWTHFDYAAFCLDMSVADHAFGNAYPGGTMDATLLATCAETVTQTWDAYPTRDVAVPLPSPDPGPGTNLVQTTTTDGFEHHYHHLHGGSVLTKVGDTLASGAGLARTSEYTGDMAHLHFATVAPTPAPAQVTVPFAFSNYELRQADGSWKGVMRGIPTGGDVVRRSGVKIAVDDLFASTYVFFVVPMVGFRIHGVSPGPSYATVEVSPDGVQYHVLRSEDPYGSVPAVYVGNWNQRRVPSNTNGRLSLFWLGRTAGSTNFFDRNGRYFFRVTLVDDARLSSRPLVVDALIRWHGERVSCVRRLRNRITSIGGDDADRGSWTLTTAAAIAEMDRGQRFYTQTSSGRRAGLTIRDERDGDRFLTTAGDDTTTNNLLRLPRCP